MEVGMKAKILAYASAVGSYLLRKVLSFAMGVILLVGLSFLIWPLIANGWFGQGWALG